jgi:putative transposase
MAVNSKEVRRLMREHLLQPKRHKRFVVTSDRDCPIFPDLVRDRMVDGPNQVWLADTTCIATIRRAISGFVATRTVHPYFI